MKTFKFVMTVLVGLLGVAVLWWLRDTPTEPVGEMVVDDFDDDDLGVDVDGDDDES